MYLRISVSEILDGNTNGDNAFLGDKDSKLQGIESNFIEENN